jgi:hypothetical protein
MIVQNNEPLIKVFLQLGQDVARSLLLQGAYPNPFCVASQRPDFSFIRF